MLYHCFMVTLWQLYGNFMGDDGDDGDDGHKNCHTGGIVCCLSCLLRQVYPSLRSPRSLRSRRSQVSCHLWKGSWRLRGRPGGLPQEDAQLERMGPGWGPDGDDTDGGCGEASLKTNIYRPGDTL